MKKNPIGLCLMLTLLCKALSAQPADSLPALPTEGLSILFNKYQFNAGDTLQIEASYYQTTGKKTTPLTLQLVLENENGKTTKLRWPMLGGNTSGEIVLPDSIPKGKYTATFAVQPSFFKIKGTVLPPSKPVDLYAMLLTANGGWLQQEVAVNADGSFLIKNWLFEKNATLIFSRKKKTTEDLDITIDVAIDSAFSPLAIARRQFYFGNLPQKLSAAFDSIGNKTNPDTTQFTGNGKELLPGVTVTAAKKNSAQKFDEAYATGLFKSSDEKVFDFLDDPSAQSAVSVIQYLQGRVAGLLINTAGDGGITAKWRGSNVSFYIDEFLVDAEQLNNLSPADVAIVKVYPPPFFGSPGGSSGGIAVYTRRGGDYSPAAKGNRHIFKLKGYTPLSTVLDIR